MNWTVTITFIIGVTFGFATAGLLLTGPPKRRQQMLIDENVALQFGLAEKTLELAGKNMAIDALKRINEFNDSLLRQALSRCDGLTNNDGWEENRG